jgi:hypothetical protein
MEDKELLEKYLELDAEVKASDAKTTKLKEERDELKKLVFSLFEKMGVRSLKSGSKSIYLLRQIWAGPKDTPHEVVLALEAIGLDNIVNFNSTSLASYVREIAREHGMVNDDGNIIADEEAILAVLPPQLKNVLKISEKIDVRVRKV